MATKATMRTLTLDEILDLQAHTRTRGDYAVNMQKLIDSGELAWDFSDIFPGKEAEAIRNSINQNFQKLHSEKEWPNLKALIDKETGHCIVVNLDVLATMQSESENGNESESE